MVRKPEKILHVHNRFYQFFMTAISRFFQHILLPGRVLIGLVCDV
jgi:hypothetical protein